MTRSFGRCVSPYFNPYSDGQVGVARGNTHMRRPGRLAAAGPPTPGRRAHSKHANAGAGLAGSGWSANTSPPGRFLMRIQITVHP